MATSLRSDLPNTEVQAKNEEEREKSDKLESGNATADQSAQNDEVYSIFGKWEKRFIVLTASVAALVSPLSTNIYFPALNTLAADLHVTPAQINLTVTTYMIFQAIAPAFIGGLSDEAGRRVSYMVCFVIYIAANIGLALQNNYAALLILRCVQSAGSSGTVAIANGVVADVATRQERGSFIGWVMIPAMLGPTAGPAIGGLLNQYLGWQSIFWFLVIFGAVFFLLQLLFFPETSRKVVGNGSIPPPAWNMTLVEHFKLRRKPKAELEAKFKEREVRSRARHIRLFNPLSTLKIVVDKEASLILLYGGLVYAGFYAVLASIPLQFQEIYGFDSVKIGLVYVPMGVGAIVSAFLNGRLMDWNYRRHAKRLGLPLQNNRQSDISNFPIEQVRLEIGIPQIYLTAAGVIAYGWAIDAGTSIAAPIVLLFFIGYTLVSAFNTFGILLVDIYRESPATATAANNLVRCLLGAASTALVNPMLDAMGRGWMFTFVGLLWIAFTPILLAVIRWGPGWRKEKQAKREEKKRLTEAQAAADVEK